MEKYTSIYFDFQERPSGKGQAFLIDLKSGKMTIEIDGCKKIYSLILDRSEVKQLREQIAACQPERWECCYGREEKRGVSWEFELTKHGQYICCSQGFNDFPDEWYDLCYFLQQYVPVSPNRPTKSNENRAA